VGYGRRRRAASGLGRLEADMLGSVAWLLSVVGWLWVVVLAFRNGIVWGLVCLFIPFAALLYVALHFSECKQPLGLLVLSFVLFAVERLL
jgi:hypothetical protein